MLFVGLSISVLVLSGARAFPVLPTGSLRGAEVRAGMEHLEGSVGLPSTHLSLGPSPGAHARPQLHHHGQAQPEAAFDPLALTLGRPSQKRPAEDLIGHARFRRRVGDPVNTDLALGLGSTHHHVDLAPAQQAAGHARFQEPHHAGPSRPTLDMMPTMKSAHHSAARAGAGPGSHAEALTSSASRSPPPPSPCGLGRRRSAYHCLRKDARLEHEAYIKGDVSLQEVTHKRSQHFLEAFTRAHQAHEINRWQGDPVLRTALRGTLDRNGEVHGVRMGHLANSPGLAHLRDPDYPKNLPGTRNEVRMARTQWKLDRMRQGKSTLPFMQAP